MSDPSDDGPATVLTAFIRHRSDVLLVRGDGEATGQWDGVSVPAEGSAATDADRDPTDADRDAATRLRAAVRDRPDVPIEEGSTLVRTGRPVRTEPPDGDAREVRPFLFDVDDRAERDGGADPVDEPDYVEWASPATIPARDPHVEGRPVADDRATVPGLWRAYERVAPSVRSVAADADHGAAFLSVRAAEVLRDRAALLAAERDAPSPSAERRAAERDEIASLAERLLSARPSMAVLRNRVNRAMAEAANRDGGGDDGDGPAATSPDFDAVAVREAAAAVIDRARGADAAAADAAADRVAGAVLTLSRSGTVRDALRAGDPSRVYVAESRPAREGVDVAEALSADDAVDCPVTLHTDAAVAHVLAAEDVDRVVVGADSVLPDGAVVNKTGTRAAATAAAREGVPVTVVAAADKVSTRERPNLEYGDSSAVYDGDAAVDVANPTFDVTPAACVDEVVTDRGAFDPADLDAVAAELRALADWRD